MPSGRSGGLGPCKAARLAGGGEQREQRGRRLRSGVAVRGRGGSRQPFVSSTRCDGRGIAVMSGEKEPLTPPSYVLKYFRRNEVESGTGALTVGDGRRGWAVQGAAWPWAERKRGVAGTSISMYCSV